jgi:hypothetical protein
MMGFESAARGLAMRRFAILFAAGLAGLAACATDPSRRDADRLALYNAHAGAQVDKFRYYGRLTRWTSLGDEALAVWTRPNEAYLLDLTGPCPDLEFTQAIGITDNLGMVHARFDKVLVLSRAPVNLPCHIARIRKLDTKALKVAESETREGA